MAPSQVWTSASTGVCRTGRAASVLATFAPPSYRYSRPLHRVRFLSRCTSVFASMHYSSCLPSPFLSRLLSTSLPALSLRSRPSRPTLLPHPPGPRPYFSCPVGTQTACSAYDRWHPRGGAPSCRALPFRSAAFTTYPLGNVTRFSCGFSSSSPSRCADRRRRQPIDPLSGERFRLCATLEGASAEPARVETPTSH